MGGLGAGRLLLAELHQPTAETATDAAPGAMVAQLTEPQRVLLDHVQLRAVDWPLFSGNPLPQEMIQGRLHNCPLGATLMAMAQATPDAITSMISLVPGTVQYRVATDPPGTYPHQTDRSFTVRFRGGSPQRVTNMLYFWNERPAYAHSFSNIGWMCFIEKAYAVLRGNNSYQVLNEGAGTTMPAPSTNDVFEDLAGPFILAHMESNQLFQGGTALELTDQLLRQTLQRADDRPTVAASRGDLPEGRPVERSHSYAVLDFRAGRVQLRNPRGGQGASFSQSLSEFRQSFAAAFQAAGDGG
jgi:hypothetical protein